MPETENISEGVSMNDARRKKINQACHLIEKAAEILDQCVEEEREAYENLPDGIRESERGQEMDDAAFSLEACAEDICSARDVLGEEGFTQ